MIVDVYHLLVKSGGHHEMFELRVQSDNDTQTNSTLVSVICDAWMSRNQRQPQTSQQGRPFSYQYSELASYDNCQNISRQGFCLRMIEDTDAVLRLPANNSNIKSHTAAETDIRPFIAV